MTSEPMMKAAEAREVLKRHLPSLDAAAIPTKSEVFVLCGHSARETHDAITALLATPQSPSPNEAAAEVEGLVQRLLLDADRLSKNAGYLSHFGTPRTHAPGRWNQEFAADIRALVALSRPTPEAEVAQEPVRLILFCPSCGAQHVDEATETWANPPHRSHLCHGCGHIWRPADVPTVGVAAIDTAGKADSPPARPRVAPEAEVEAVLARVGERIADEVEKAASGRQTDCGQAARDVCAILSRSPGEAPTPQSPSGCVDGLDRQSSGSPPIGAAGEAEAAISSTDEPLPAHTQEGSAKALTVLERVLLAALTDARAGWRYIRDHHGDLYGVGWDRVEQAADAAIALATGRGSGSVGEANIARDISGETVCGFRVAAYRETHPEHGDKFGHRYSEHWSTPSQNSAVKVERLFTETQLRAALASPTLSGGAGPDEAHSAAQVDGVRSRKDHIADARNMIPSSAPPQQGGG